RLVKYSLTFFTACTGCKASHCTGYSAVASAARSGWVTRNRVSATIRNSASALKNISLDSTDGPCRKMGGGDLSSVPKAMVRRHADPADGACTGGLFRGKDGAHAVHALQ